MIQRARNNNTVLLSLVIVSVILFSLLTVYFQFMKLGIVYLEQGNQIERHTWVLSGTAGNPWQYRVLSEYLVEGVVRFFGLFNIPHHIAIGFVSFRFIQNTIIFLLAYFYYRQLGLSAPCTLIGLSLLAWGMTHAYFDSDLQFNTYSDVIFFLLAGSVILLNKDFWIIPITISAALNRETSGLIPFMLLAARWPLGNKKLLSKTTAIFTISLLSYMIIFIALRLIFGYQHLVIPHGHHPGFDMLKYNLLRPITWVQLFATLGIIPILALLSFDKWPHTLKAYFWAIVPIWFAVHLFGSVIAETRLLLVPQALIFIPGALLLLKYSQAIDRSP